MKPTYSASQVKEMCQTLPMEHEVFKTLVGLIEEEINLYSESELEILTQASMIMFNRSLLNGSLKFLKG